MPTPCDELLRDKSAVRKRLAHQLDHCVAVHELQRVGVQAADPRKGFLGEGGRGGEDSTLCTLLDDRSEKIPKDWRADPRPREALALENKGLAVPPQKAVNSLIAGGLRCLRLPAKIPICLEHNFLKLTRIHLLEVGELADLLSFLLPETGDLPLPSLQLRLTLGLSLLQLGLALCVFFRA